MPKPEPKVPAVLTPAEERIVLELVDGCMGMAQHEVHRILNRCFTENGGRINARWIREAKNRLIMERFKGAISIEDPSGADVGGNEELMEYADVLKSSFGNPDARARGIPEAKGIILVGFPGCGKSITPKALARKWGMPLIRLNLGEQFSKYVGESEQNAKSIQGVLESLAPCIVWIDEIEKGFAGTSGGGDGDSGTALRVFGSWLSWMQDKKAPVFVVATANNIDTLRDELKRKGRFDEIFFVDIPTLEERKKIAAIHVSRLGSFVKGVDAEAVARATEGYSGAEIEAAIIDAMKFANHRRAEGVATQDVLNSIGHTAPMTKTSPRLLPALRKWAAESQVRRASNSKDAVVIPDTPAGKEVSLNRTIDFNDKK